MDVSFYFLFLCINLILNPNILFFILKFQEIFYPYIVLSIAEILVPTLINVI